MATLLKITAAQTHPLYDVAATRLLEQRSQSGQPQPSLMQRAGLATARLALALAPHARHIWVACGPGNNGGDGFEAAVVLHQLGKSVSLTWTGMGQAKAGQPTDAHQARARALSAGLTISAEPPTSFDLAIDALLGIGSMPNIDRPGARLMANWLQRMQQSRQPVLCVDVPTGLDADSGAYWNVGSQPEGDRTGLASRHTLSLLTLKPGLFTANGRDQAGQVWWDDLGVDNPTELAPCAFLQGLQAPPVSQRARGLHASHKGSFGDVAVLGGETQDDKAGGGRRSMAGAALLAARAALNAGAGRVHVALLGEAGPLSDAMHPELMFRAPEALDLQQQVLVCGCGGGQAVRRHLPAVLSRAQRLVLDADGLNAVAQDSSLQTLLAARKGRGLSTVLTPHPLEAARLLKLSAAEVQADRRGASHALAARFACVVVLKGSGSMIAAPGQTTVINHSGNALLATAGTGDVLAGMIGAAMAAGHDAWTAATRACFEHGKVADDFLISGAGAPSFTASRLTEGLGLSQGLGLS